MAKPALYIKGYKLDDQKIRSRFPRKDHESEHNYELSYYDSIIFQKQPTSTSDVEWVPTAS